MAFKDDWASQFRFFRIKLNGSEVIWEGSDYEEGRRWLKEQLAVDPRIQEAWKRYAVDTEGVV